MKYKNRKKIGISLSFIFTMLTIYFNRLNLFNLYILSSITLVFLIVISINLNSFIRVKELTYLADSFLLENKTITFLLCFIPLINTYLLYALAFDDILFLQVE